MCLCLPVSVSVCLSLLFSVCRDTGDGCGAARDEQMGRETETVFPRAVVGSVPRR